MIVHGCRRRARSWGGAVGRNTKCTCDTQLLLPSVRKALRKLNRGKICAPCMIRGACAAKRAPSWQDIHVVYPPTAICGAFRMHGTHILPEPAHFWIHGGDILPRRGLFPSEAFFGIHRGRILPPPDTGECISRVPCRRRTAESALRAHVAMRRPPGNALCGHMLPCPTAR